VHQTVVHNRLTAVHEAAQEAQLAASIAGAAPRDSTASARTSAPEVRLQGAVDHLVNALLFSGEAPLAGPMRGTTPFAQEFSRRGPSDHLGRSLREFDLERRLFKYPLSFLIYSESFDALPGLARREVYRRLREVLSGADTSAAFAHLQPADRTALIEILNETKPGFAAGR